LQNFANFSEPSPHFWSLHFHTFANDRDNTRWNLPPKMTGLFVSGNFAIGTLDLKEFQMKRTDASTVCSFLLIYY
jgi:hypothetical protein